jgi:cell division protein FtsB
MAAAGRTPLTTPVAMKWLVAGLLLLLLLLQIPLWLAEGSFRDVRLLRQTMDRQERESAVLEARNQALKAEVEDLKAGLDAIEERARTDLGLVKKGEVFYHLLPAGPEQDGDATTAD